jgi:predicted GIY-YIG superfamily endonuclease
MKNGYVYIISNPAWPKWIKLGITDNLEKRLSTYQTGDPNRAYKIEYFIEINNYKEIEKILWESIKPFAKKRLNEWYEIDKLVAKVRLQEILSDYDTKTQPLCDSSSPLNNLMNSKIPYKNSI